MMPVAPEKESRVSQINASAIHAKAIQLCKHVLEMTSAAGSGHPTTGMALAHIIVELMYRQMRYDSADPWNPASDRLVLSAGHGVPIVYAAYADLGGAVGTSRENPRQLRIEDLQSLRELKSELDGHPNPAEGFPFFDAATGSLGQGLSVAAGLALAARLDGIDKRIYCIVGDGESREGQIWEAADFIVDHELCNVCAIVSCNGHGQAAPVSAQQSAESVAAKFTAFGWNVLRVNGHDPEELAQAFHDARTAEQPTAIVATTVKGWGVDSIIGKNYHGKPLSKVELADALRGLDATATRLDTSTVRDLRPFKPAASFSLDRQPKLKLSSFEKALRRVNLEGALHSKKLATRVAFGAALVALGNIDDAVVSLDADVSNSTFANLFQREHPDRFIECKIAEQNMISAAAGLSAAGKIPFVSSFAKFIARATDQIDMAAISRANIKIVGSHSGVSLAADGPSQMSLADLAYFRSMTGADSVQGPVCRVFHPADAICAYRCVELMANVNGLCYMRTHRPDAPFIYPLDEEFKLNGCKHLRKGNELTLVSSGFMLHTVLQAAGRLAESDVTCNVFDAYTFPMDPREILKAAEGAGGKILTIEDNYLGGLHAELAEAAAQEGRVRVAGMTVRRIPKSAKTADEMFVYVGVGLDQIIEKAKSLVLQG